MPVTAGPHIVGVSFVRETVGAGRSAATAAARPGHHQRPGVHGLRERGLGPDRRSVSRTSGPAKDTPSRRAIFVCQPKRAAEERACATKILSRMARLAYRRPVIEGGCRRRCWSSSTIGRRDGGSFDAGIQFALERMLVDPDFLLRVFRDPPPEQRAASGAARIALSDIEVASRLSFFLWSSIPGRALADAGRARPADQSRDARKGSAPHAGRSARRPTRWSTISPRSG